LGINNDAVVWVHMLRDISIHGPLSGSSFTQGKRSRQISNNDNKENNVNNKLFIRAKPFILGLPGLVVSLLHSLGISPTERVNAWGEPNYTLRFYHLLGSTEDRSSSTVF
jgi:hypothetical protein